MIYSGIQSRKKRNEFEYLEQKALFEWAKNPATLKKYPAIDLMSSSLNGVRLGISQAKKAKYSGMLAGEYDIKLPVKRGSYIGLIIEMKHGKNTLTEEQKWYKKRMQEEGHYAVECWNWEDAKKEIENYLSLM